MENEKKQRLLIPAPSILLAIFHVAIGIFAATYAVIFWPSRTSIDLTCLIAVSSIALAWALVLERRWAVIASAAVIFSLALMTQNERIFPRHAPAPRGPHDINVEFIFATFAAYVLFGLVSLVELPTAVYLLFRLRDRKKSPWAASRRNWIVVELLFLLLSIPIIWFVDGQLPRRALNASKEREQARAKRREKKELDDRKRRENDELLLTQAIADLKHAADVGDRKKSEEALAVIVKQAYQLTVGDAPEKWKAALKTAGPAAFHFILEEIIVGRCDGYPLLGIIEAYELEEPLRERAALARRRVTIAKMYLRPPAFDSSLGELEAEGNRKKVIQWLIEAISDRESTTPQERIDLALALEEAAMLEEYDARPAIGTLQAIVDSDDADSVKQAAAAALAKAKIDRVEH